MSLPGSEEPHGIIYMIIEKVTNIVKLKILLLQKLTEHLLEKKMDP